MDFTLDYYNILEISSSATHEEVKAAYRRQARKHHPDANPNGASDGEKFKLVNEAYQVLVNAILREQYDDYFRTQNQTNESQQSNSFQETASANKRTYRRSKTSLKETRFYVRGSVVIDFWGNESLVSGTQLGRERRYKIHPTKAVVKIDEQDIFKYSGIPLEYLRAYRESELFATSIAQPVKCIINMGVEELRYELNLEDIRIKNIQLEGVTKHEGRSFGMLKGDLYAYTSKFDVVVEEEEVTEWFGETGQFQSELDEDVVRIRREYFNYDGSRFWGPWTETARPNRKKTPPIVAAEGCSPWLMVPLLALGVIFFPRILIGLGFILVVALCFWLVEAMKSLFRGHGATVIGLLVGLIFIVALLGAGRSRSAVRSADRKTRDSIAIVTSTPKQSGMTERGDARSVDDSLISHLIQWEDFGGALHRITLSVRKNDLDGSIGSHHNMKSNIYGMGFSEIYSDILSYDNQRMDLVYSAFDSLRYQENLDDIGFARAVVSAVQSLPYYLVLNRGCNDNYSDSYIRDYMEACTQDCCVGEETFGVRTPVEFTSDLKGDCDTRALFLYSVLNHFGYKVALVTSEYYKHAMIAVSLQKHVSAEGGFISFKGNDYYLWETTGKGFDIGQIPPQMNNLQNWSIALIN